jgi:3-oxoacyl-[acyl-carrier-protein] synthase-3
MLYTKIIGTGSYIPDEVVTNNKFFENIFFDENSKVFQKSNQEIINDLVKITGIHERRYICDDQVTSDIAYLAAEDALLSSVIDGETLDYIIVAHNFGDVSHVVNRQSVLVPNIASKVKHMLGIKNPYTVAFDILFGCPGWLQGMIIADSLIKTGAKRIMVIGAETLSRVSDPHDRDSMIYADGAGATILETIQSENPVGIIGHKARTDAEKYAYLLRMGASYDPSYKGSEKLKMDGGSIYEYALNYVPFTIKECLNKINCPLAEVKKILIHQANEKMDEKILRNLFGLYGKKKVEIPPDIMPMTISWLGNSSVATIPTLLDLIFKKEIKDHTVKSGDIILFASVGSGMNINVMIYKMP